MSEKQETIPDIVAEMRGARTEFPFVYLMGEPDTPEVIDFETKEIIEPRKINIRRVTVKELADRIEAAHKQEVGNAAKMREVVELLARVILPPQEEYPAEYGGGKVPDKDGWLAWIRQVQSYAKSALAEPPRQCDVGTAEEQFIRYCKFTGRYNPCSFEGYARCAEDCPIHQKLTQEGHGELLCKLEWAQMPYEEGGEK